MLRNVNSEVRDVDSGKQGQSPPENRRGEEEIVFSLTSL